jgi:hypothetical protein
LRYCKRPHNSAKGVNRQGFHFGSLKADLRIETTSNQREV